ncbi:hypothetical protein BC828DRAFT_382241 [Blastocladiella britannica]|nr:hypothetical protein BC828DRAFT_382241 [Blastocladiella britannica]
MAATAAAAAAAAKFPDASRSGEFHTAIHSCFKLLHQILVMQSRFLHEIVPKFVLAPRSTSTLRELDKLLATRSRSVVDLVSFVSPEYDAFGDLGILSVKILASLSLAPTYGPSQGASPLVSILSANSSANTILKAYLDKFRDYDMAPLPFTLGAYDELMVHSPRLAILQLIVSNLRRPQVPSLGHFILGLVKSGALVADERSMADGTLLSLVVKLASAPGGQAPDLPLGLVELAYEAMYHLASHPATSALFSVLEQGYFASLATYWLSASRLPSVDGIPVAKDQFIELLPADSDMAQPNLRASMMLSTPSKRMFAAAPGQQQRTSSGQRTTAFSSAATGAGRRTASGAATAGSQGKIVSEIVSTLSAWTWLLRLMAVQLKAFADQPAFLTDLIKQLYLSPGGGDCRMVQVIHAAMRVCVPSAPETHPQAAALFQSVMSDDVGGAGTWPTLTDSQGLVLFDITKARTVAESIAPRSIQDQFASTKPLPATPGPSSFATGGNQTVSGHAAVVEGLLVLLAHENRKRRVLHAQTQLVQAWTETVSVTALACIGQLGGPTDSQSDRSSTLVALLVTVQELIRASPPASRVYFVKCLPLLLAILDQAVGMDSGSDHSVLDRTLATMVSACKDSDSTPFIRGNLYVGLLIVLEMTGISTGSSPLDPAASILNRSIVPGWTNASSIMANRSMFMRSTLGGASVMGKSSGGTMLANSSQDTLLRTLRTLGGESFLQALCKDAAQPSIWQSVALTALDVLCQWSLHSSTMRPWILESLQATGDVQSLAGVLIHMLPRLAGICSAASDDSLSADDSVTLLTYQSLLALLLRLSMHRQTRSMLIEAGVIGALADAACFSYIAGDGGRSSRGGGFGASVGRRTQTSQRSMMMDIDVNPALSRAVDPYAYFEGQLAAEQVPEAFERYNRVLSSALELLGFITTVHAVQSRPASSSSSPTAESGGSSDANPVLVKSCERFLAAHAASLTRVVTACTSVLRERVPTDDAKDDAELSLLTQVAQIASLADFLARSRAHVAPTVVQALFALLVVASRRDFGPARRGHLALRAERLVLQISGSIVALSLTLATTPGSTAAAVRYLFDADLAAAKDTHYVTLNRLTLGVLVLSMQQHLSRLQHASMVAEEVDHRATSGTAATSDDWRAYVQGSAGDVAQEIGFEHVSPAKRDAALRARLTALRGELATERAMLVRNLEVAMTVLRLHVLHYERQASSAVDGVAAASMGRGPQGSSAAASLGRLSTISAMKMDARTLFPMLKAQIKAAVQQSDAKAFLVAICDMIFASFGIPQDD